ncbi:hypothetical protein ACTWJ9_33525 (plasmid) [Streptomyces sp. GDS52]|uniref:hypothetical protein n=1 Tax=Streptomyces sp. GDS52 TaxID=3406419 RepID=UPI003FCF3C6C
MPQWNLSVRLTGQGSGLARTLRNTSRDARAASRDVQALTRDIGRLRAAASRDIRLGVRVDARSLRADVRRAVTTARAGQELRVRLGVDARFLRADARRAITAARSGQDALAVNLRLGNSMQLRREVEAAVRWAAWGHRIEIPIGLRDPNQLRRDVSAAVRRAQQNQTIRVRVTADTSALRGLTRGLGGGSGSSGGGLDIGLAGLLPIATAVVPLVAGLSTSVLALAGNMAIGGTAAAAFGVALAGQIGPLGEVAEAETKYQEAVSEHGKSSAEAIKAQVAYQKLLAQMPPETQKAAIGLSQLKQEFSDWSDEMSGFTMVPVTKSFTLLRELLPHLSPEVKSFSTQLDRLMDVAGGGMRTPGFDAFSKKVAALTDQKLDSFTDSVIHLMRVLSEGGATDGALGKILDYMRQHGPAAREALDAIGDAVGNLVEGAAEAGPTMLTLVTAAARLVAALPPELVGIILQVATALKLLQLSGAGMAALAAGMGRVRTAIAALGTTAATAGGGIAGLRAAFLSLGVAARASIIVAAVAAIVVVLSELSEIGQEAPPDVDKLTTSLGKLGRTGKVAGEAARAFGKDLGGLADSLRTLARPSNTEKTQQFLTSLIGMDSTPVKNAKEDLDAVDQSLANLVQSGKGDLAAAAFERIAAAMREQGMSGKELEAQLDDYKSKLADQAFEAELAAQSMGLFGEAAQATSAKLDAQKQSADGLRQAIVALNDVNRAAGSAMSAFEQSLDDTSKAVKEHGAVLKWRDGELDLGTQKARDAEKVLSDLAANTDAAATAAREQGKSWEHVSGIYDEGRDAFVRASDTLGLTREQAELLAASYLNIPDKKELSVEMRTEDAVSGLDAVIAAIEETPDEKSVTVSALTEDAQSMLRELGFEVTELKDGSFRVTANTATAEASLADVQSLRDGLADKSITIDARTQDTINSLQGVQDKVATTKGKTITMKAPTSEARHQLELLGFRIRDTKGKNVQITVPTGSQRANVAALAGAIAGLRNKTVTITTNYVITGNQARRSGAHGSQLANARGGVWDYYADGGIRTPRVHKFASGAENHVAQIAPAGSWRVWAEPETGGEAYIPLSSAKRTRSRAILEETARRLGGDPAAIQWNAAGSITDWRYDPTSGSLYSASDAGAAGRKTKKVKVKGGKTKEVEYFDLGAVERKLKSASKATKAWNKDLERVADRVGGDVADALASMGEEGVKLAAKMAKGSTKYINEMAKALRGLQATAKASLTDYTRQLTGANKLNKTFADNLAKLAAQGYGDLAAQLADQNDEAAQQLAAAAVKDKGKASKANTQAKAANNALTSDQVQDLVQIIAAIKTKSTGIHDVAGTTGLGEDVIIAIANKAKKQISSSLGTRATRFLADLGKANKHLAYADGGIRAGIYASRAGLIRWAEPETGGEAYIPLGGNKRRTALPVLADVAQRFGVGLTNGQAGRVVIIREQGPLVGASHFHIGARQSDRDLARAIEARQSYQLRRLARGGVGARG